MTDIRREAWKSLERIGLDRGRPSARAFLPYAIVGLIGAAAGALLAFMLDPQMGRTRRAVTGDRVAGGVRRVGRWSARRARYAASTAEGLGRRIGSSAGSERQAPLDEVALAHKVESILFRDPDIEKGSINVNAEHDAVFLRGTVTDRSRAQDIQRRVEAIDGVGTVVNLLRVEDDAGGELAVEDVERPIWTAPR
jgi:hypothetical protein